MGFVVLLAGVIILALLLTGAVALVAAAGYVLLEVGIVALLGYGAYRAVLALKGRRGSRPTLNGWPRRTFKGHTAGPRRPEDGTGEDATKESAGHQTQGSTQGRDRRRASDAARRATVDHAAYTYEYVYLDPEDPDAADIIKDVMGAYLSAPVVGAYASSVQMTLDALAFRERNLLGEIDAKFAPGSISWEKFHTTAAVALEAVLRNCALLGNRVQTFDEAEYERYEAFLEAGGFATDPHPGQAKLERWKLCCDTLSEMDEIRDVTDGLMTELGKLGVEVSRLDSSTTPDDTRDVVEEVARLVDETKLYR